MNKFILVDFDGVLTSVRYTLQCRQEHRQPNTYGLDWFDPACLQALKTIVDQTGAGIVISSSWRELGDEVLRRVWEPMPGQFVETTPIWILTKREAVEAWISAHPDDRFVILDDTDLQLPRQVRTDPEVGLTMADARWAVRLMEVPVYPRHPKLEWLTRRILREGEFAED